MQCAQEPNGKSKSLPSPIHRAKDRVSDICIMHFTKKDKALHRKQRDAHINIAYQANHRDVDVPMHVFRGRYTVTNSKAAKLTTQEFVKALSLSLPQLARPDVS